MKNLTINYTTGKIEMTAAFAKAASKYASNEYKMLTDARHDFPEYEVKVIVSKKKNNTKFKNLNLEYIENYIRNHDDDNNTKLNTFATLRGMKLDDDSQLVEIKDDIKKVASFMEIKEWFLETYHEAFENYGKNVDDIMKKTREARKARKAA